MQNRPEDCPSDLRLSLEQAERAGQVGSWQWDLSGTWVSWSDGTYRIFGRRRDEFALTPESFFSCVHPLDRERAKNLLLDALRQQSNGEVEFRVTRPDGAVRWVRATVRAVAADAGSPAHATGAVQDLTEQRQLQDQLRMAQRRELLGLLAGGIAHDFNNLLTVIRGRTEMVVDDAALSTFARESLQQVIEAVDRAASLTRQLTAFGRAQAVQFQPCDLNKVITHLLKMLRRILGENIPVQVYLAPELPVVQADPGMIEHLLMNLAVVAKEDLPKSGELIISTETLSASALAGKRPGRFIRLIADHSGGGFTPGALAADAPAGPDSLLNGQGTRIGLRAAYGIVEQLHGWCTLEPNPDGGHALHIYLPVAAPTEGPGQGGRGKLELRGGSERILLVEDDQGLRTFIGLLLGRLGYKVLDAASGPEALRVWTAQRGDFDLLLTDVVMPGGLNGFELAEQLQRSKPGLRIIAMTGYTEESGRPKTASRIECVTKPFTPESLALAVRHRLDVPSSGG